MGSSQQPAPADTSSLCHQRAPRSGAEIARRDRDAEIARRDRGAEIACRDRAEIAEIVEIASRFRLRRDYAEIVPTLPPVGLGSAGSFIASVLNAALGLPLIGALLGGKRVAIA